MLLLPGGVEGGVSESPSSPGCVPLFGEAAVPLREAGLPAPLWLAAELGEGEANKLPPEGEGTSALPLATPVGIASNAVSASAPGASEACLLYKRMGSATTKLESKRATRAERKVNRESNAIFMHAVKKQTEDMIVGKERGDQR